MERYRLSALMKDVEMGGDIDVVIAADAQRALDGEREKVKSLGDALAEEVEYRLNEREELVRQLATLQAQLEALRQERDEARHSRDVFKSQMIAHMNDRDSYAADLATLQAQLRQVEGERDHAKKMEAVQKEVADNQTWHVQKLKDWRDTVTLALQRPGGARFEDVPEHIKGLVRERDALSIWVNALRDSYDDLESRHADMLGDLTTLTRPTPRRNDHE